eukprot:CAMPEP_0119307608 /NCGR_PEP_ID=MMETSP1333-20130426/8062_1 /TAXON_ID=418940 /ORGANISM="Scyphosphaera apsteinii, Strain RCC1455" /LENGTH=42 /DNA_ID= /DNA_START= /DNA_END= /DNA_ORIENTATION=
MDPTVSLADASDAANTAAASELEVVSCGSSTLTPRSDVLAKS